MKSCEPQGWREKPAAGSTALVFVQLVSLWHGPQQIDPCCAATCAWFFSLQLSSSGETVDDSGMGK